MAHEIEIVDGVASMAYVGETPWHGLGKAVPADVSPSQMLKAAGLDWQVVRKELYFNSESGPVPTKARALVRSTDDKVLTVVTDNWNPVQNEEAFEFFSDFTAAGDMEMHTAGSLRDGKMVWALAKVKESFELFGGDVVESFLLFSNPHEFGRSIDIRFTPTRVVCNNTMSMALGENAKHFVRLNHRAKFNGDQVKGMLGVASERMASYKEQAQFLGKKKYTKETLTEYFNRVFPSLTKDEEKTRVLNKIPVSRQAEEAMAVIHTQPGSNFAEGTWWQAFNTVTYMADHLLGRTKDSRLTSAWYGTNRTRKEKALNLAVEYAEMV
jgi:phage/plasmid-like protein (TIGR03299 family)